MLKYILLIKNKYAIQINIRECKKDKDRRDMSRLYMILGLESVFHLSEICCIIFC
jgi:hypothetical protein